LPELPSRRRGVARLERRLAVLRQRARLLLRLVHLADGEHPVALALELPGQDLRDLAGLFGYAPLGRQLHPEVPAAGHGDEDARRDR
jgi:hypothetical protein